MWNERPLLDNSVQCHLVVEGACLLALRVDTKRTTVKESDLREWKQWRTQRPVRLARAKGKQAQRAQYVPGAHCARVLIPCEIVRGVEPIEHAMDPVLRPVSPAGRAKHVEHVMHRLVGMGVLTKVHRSHLRHF